MKIRTWHKRNVQAATEIEATAICSNGGDQWPHVQITFSGAPGRLQINMTPEEAEMLISQLKHCASRYRKITN